MKDEEGIQVAESANACVAVVDVEREPQLRHGRSRTVLMRLRLQELIDAGTVNHIRVPMN
jgi:hypothetical protein